MNKMTRTISKSVADILEGLELDNKAYITLEEIAALAHKEGVLTDPSMIASRLKQTGWLLPTSQRGVWEFSPAARAGAFSQNDPLREIKAFQIANPDISCCLCLQTAAWALGLADRVPYKKELAFPEIPRRHIAKDIMTFRFKPTLEPKEVRGVPCLVPESIIVHLVVKPDQVKSWESVMEWLPDVVYESDAEKIMLELVGRPASVYQRTGYLLQMMYPAAADAIFEKTCPSSKIWFGPRQTVLRNDEKWKIADSILPFSPKELEKVK